MTFAQALRRSRAPLRWSQAAGLYQERKARQTGHYVGVYDAAYLGLSIFDGGPYVTVCEEHGTNKHHRTLEAAQKAAAKPLAWCEECRAEKEAAKP